MARTLVNAKQLDLMSGSTATLAKFAQGIYTDGMSMESGSLHGAGTLTFYDGGSIAYAESKINLYSNTNVGGTLNVDGTLTANTSLTLDTTTITTAEIGVLDSVTAGAAAASKAVVLDASKNIATIGTVGCGAITSTGNSAFAQGTFSGRVIVDDATDATSATDGSLQTDGGLSVAKDVVAGNDVKLLSDAAVLSFGASSEVTLTHVADVGLTLTHTGTGDNLPVVLQLKSEEDAVIADEVIASLEFAAGDSDGTDGATVAAGIHAIAEEAFAADANATSLVFTAADSETAAASATPKMTLASTGNLTTAGSVTAVGSFIIGSADMSEADLEKLDGITNGTAAASKAVVLDASKNIATIGTVGCGAITSTGNSAMAQLTTSGRVIVDDSTDATSTTDGSLQTDGGLSVAKDGVFGNDVKLKNDGAILSFGDDGEVTLTHSHNGGLLLNSSFALAFGDSATYIHQVSDGNLKLAADGALLLASDTIQCESANSLDPMMELKNTTNDALGARLHFLKDKGAAGADDDIVGMIAWSGDNDAQQQTTYAEMICQIADASDGTEGGKLVLRVASHDGEMNNGIIISDGDVEDEIDITLGNGANSLVTIPGNLTVAGTTTTVNTVTMEAANAVVFEGATADGNETTLSIVDPTGDHTQYLINQSGYVPLLAAVTTTAISSTPAELNLLDGDTAVGSSITIADGDGLLVHDGGVMKTIPFTDVKTYCSGLDIDTFAALGGAALHQTQDHFIFSDSGVEKKITFSNLQDAVFADVSGDATIAAGGALTIAAASVENSMLADDAVGADELAANAVVNASVAANAAITYSKMEAVTAGQIMVGNGSNVGTLVAVSGDVTMGNDGAVTIAANAVEGSMLNANVISGQTDIGAAIALTDELMISDNGVLRRTDVSRLAGIQAGAGLADISGQLGVDFMIDTVIGSSGHNYTTATGVYVCSETAVTGSEMVFLNGQMLMPGADLAGGDYSIATGSVELHPDLKLDGDDVLRVYYLGT